MIETDGWKPVTSKSRSQNKNAQKLKATSSTTTKAESKTSDTKTAVNGESSKTVVNQENFSKASGDFKSPQSNAGYSNGIGNPVKQNGLAPANKQVRQQPYINFSANDPRKAIEKEIKGLAKYDANAKNTGWLFEEELKKSEDRLKRAFAEMRNRLDQREQQLSAELRLCRTEGSDLLAVRQETQKQLQLQTSRVVSMNGRDVEELKQKIKKFLQEKRVDDDLAKSLRFQYEPDKLIASISDFGEVVPVGGKRAGVKQCPSMTSLVSVEGGGGDGSSIDSSSVCSKVNEVNVGGLVIQSNSMDAQQLADLTRQLQENLRLQGITDDIFPEVNESLSSAMPQRRRPPPTTPNVGRPSKGGPGRI